MNRIATGARRVPTPSNQHPRVLAGPRLERRSLCATPSTTRTAGSFRDRRGPARRLRDLLCRRALDKIVGDGLSPCLSDRLSFIAPCCNQATTNRAASHASHAVPKRFPTMTLPN